MGELYCLAKLQVFAMKSVRVILQIFHNHI